jgi:hypothetical protein
MTTGENGNFSIHAKSVDHGKIFDYYINSDENLLISYVNITTLRLTSTLVQPFWIPDSN